MDTAADHFCGRCGQPLGSNSDCPDCADWLLRRSADDVDVGRAEQVFENASEWLRRNVGAGPEHFFRQVGLLVEMLGDTLSRKVSVPWPTVGVMVAALAYVVAPIDLMPDWIPALGLADDAAMVLGAVRLIRKDLVAYARGRGLDLARYGLADDDDDGGGGEVHDIVES